MLRVCICCGGGFSSSFLMRKVKNELVEKGYGDKLTIGFSPFSEVHELYDQYDVIMCCPHLSYKIPPYIEKFGNVVPIYVIPSLMYGTMNVAEIYQDALDIYQGYKLTHNNPMHFPGEENNMERKNRSLSYRRTYKIKGDIDFNYGK